jgi:predicted site-specific integrase-resolvase
MPPYLCISEAARYLGVCPKTLRRWDAANRVKPAFRTLGAHRRYDLAVLKEIRISNPLFSASTPHQPTPVRAITYARVSSSLQKQRGDLQRQVEDLSRFCLQNHWQIIQTIQDVGSGVNDARQGLHHLIRAVSRGQCDVVVVAYPDRLARFGINVLRACFAEWGTSLRIVNDHPLGAAPESTLITDITAILYSYMGKLYRLRRHGGLILD